MNHYVYCIYDTVTNMKYIGKRSSSKNPRDDLGTHYFSSSFNKQFIKDQKLNHMNYQYEILSIFDNSKSALKEESRLHYKYNVGINPLFYNRCNSTMTGFDVTGKCVMKDIQGNIYHVNCEDPRITSGELVGITKGYFFVKDDYGNKIKMKTGTLLTDYTFHTKNTIIVRNKKGTQFRVDNNDTRLYNDIVPVTMGYMCVKDNNGNKQYITTEFYYQNKNELYTSLHNKVIAKDNNGNTIVIDKDKFKESGLSGITANMIWINNSIVNKLSYDIPDGWKRGQLRKNKTAAQNINKIAITNGYTNKYISKDDIIPDGWRKGVKPNATNTGKMWINNSIENKLITKTHDIESGWFKGRCKK